MLPPPPFNITDKPFRVGWGRISRPGTGARGTAPAARHTRRSRSSGWRQAARHPTHAQVHTHTHPPPQVRTNACKPTRPSTRPSTRPEEAGVPLPPPSRPPPELPPLNRVHNSSSMCAEICTWHQKNYYLSVALPSLHVLSGSPAKDPAPHPITTESETQNPKQLWTPSENAIPLEKCSNKKIQKQLLFCAPMT